MEQRQQYMYDMTIYVKQAILIVLVCYNLHYGTRNETTRHDTTRAQAKNNLVHRVRYLGPACAVFKEIAHPPGQEPVRGATGKPGIDHADNPVIVDVTNAPPERLEANQPPTRGCERQRVLGDLGNHLSRRHLDKKYWSILCCKKNIIRTSFFA